MRVGIIGDKNRASAWEKHLRPLIAVDEVIITSSLSDISDVHACILLDESPENLQLLSDSIRLGIHSYLISELPTNEEKLKTILAHSQESDVRVQFSHWPTLSPASHWMKQQLRKPDFIQIIKEQSYLSYSENQSRFSHSWIDEIGWIVKWMGMGTHRIEVKKVVTGCPDTGMHIYIKFENGASASLFFIISSEKNQHRRIAAGSKILLDNNVDQQIVRKSLPGDNQRLTVSSHNFDAAKSAELSAMLFFKAIKMKSPTAFTPYDALQVSTVLKKVTGMLDTL